MPIRPIPIRDLVPRTTRSPAARPRPPALPPPSDQDFKEQLAYAFYMAPTPPLPSSVQSPSVIRWQTVRIAAVAALLLVGAAFLCAALLPSSRDRRASVADWRAQLAPVADGLPGQPEEVADAEPKVEEPPPRPAEEPRRAVQAPEEPVVLQKEERAAPKEPESVFGGRPVGELLGTAVEFLDNPQEASKMAARESKLLFVLHVSGNFEDPQFT